MSMAPCTSCTVRKVEMWAGREEEVQREGGRKETRHVECFLWFDRELFLLTAYIALELFSGTQSVLAVLFLQPQLSNAVIKNRKSTLRHTLLAFQHQKLSTHGTKDPILNVVLHFGLTLSLFSMYILIGTCHRSSQSPKYKLLFTDIFSSALNIDKEKQKQKQISL